MPEREITLVAGAKDKARELDVPVGFLQSDEQYDREVSKNKVTVHNREFHLLQHFGLIKEAALVSPAADQPEAEAAADTSRTKTSERGPSGTDSAVDPGGTGHQKGETHDNASRVQGEIKSAQKGETASKAADAREKT